VGESGLLVWLSWARGLRGGRLCDIQYSRQFAGISLLTKGMQDKGNSAAAKINAISNKFIAHAATPQSVQYDPLSSESIDVEEFWK